MVSRRTPPQRLASRTLAQFPAFQSADFRALWFASGVASVSLWAMLMARAWLALDLSGSGFAVGAVTFAAMGPWVLAPIGGTLADRFDRARMLQLARMLLLGLALGLAALEFSGATTVWHLIVFAAAAGVARAFEIPAEQSLLPNTIDPESILNAITLNSMVRFGSRLIGPLAGAPLLVGGGMAWLFVLAAGLYALSIVTLFRIRVRSRGGLQDRAGGALAGMRSNLREGLVYIGRNRMVLLVITLAALHCMLTMSFDALLTIFAQEELGGDAGTFGALLMGVGGGALAGTLALSFVSSGPLRGALFFAAGLLSSLAMIMLGFATTLPLAIVATVLAGGSQAVFMALSSTFIQSVVPDALRGRVLSLYTLFAAGIMSVMIFVNGAAADVVGMRMLIIIPGFSFLVLLLAWTALKENLRLVFRTGQLQERGAATALAAASG